MPEHKSFLVIVESPSKCKSIQKYLKSLHPTLNFQVEASFGHIRDLRKQELGVAISGQHVDLNYELDVKKQDVINRLKKLVNEYDLILLASDNDREGESIAWHLMQALKLKKGQYKRMVFNEITEEAIANAFVSLRTIDMDLVNAQQARRVIDRIVGFKISPLLWKNFKVESGLGLSVGRVQSAALKYVVQHEADIERHVSESYYTVRGETSNDSVEVKLCSTDGNLKRFTDESSASAFLKALKGIFTLAQSRIRDSRENPGAPFITSTLQQEASAKLGFSVKMTMMLAQQLYEKGYITYMRTDSYALSERVVVDIKKYIVKRWGNDMYEQRDFTKKKRVKNGQEAHEAIRPTKIDRIQISGDSALCKLYELIWTRTVASHMKHALHYVLDFSIKDACMLGARSKYNDLSLKGQISMLHDPGFLAAYGQSAQSNTSLKLLEHKQTALSKEILVKRLTAKQTWSGAPSRYNEAGLIKVLERDGIGRPSTYAGILDKLYLKNYIVVSNTEGTKHTNIDFEWTGVGKSLVKTTYDTVSNAETNRLLPTEIGIRVHDYMTNNFSEIVDVEFTSNMEEQLDAIANGDIHWESVIKQFWGVLIPRVEIAEQSAPRAKDKEVLQLARDEFIIDGVTYIVRLGKYGPLIEKKGMKEFTSLTAYLRLTKKAYTEVTEEDVSLLTSMPKHINSQATLRYGRYGFYLQVGDQNYMLPAKWVKQEFGSWAAIGSFAKKHIAIVIKLKEEYLLKKKLSVAPKKTGKVSLKKT